MKFFKFVLLLFIPVFLFSSCSSTKEFIVADETEIISENEANGDVHYVKSYEKVTSENKTDGKLVAYYTVGVPFIVVGTTVWQVIRVAGYSIANVFLGWASYDEMKRGRDGVSPFLPDAKKDKAEYNKLIEDYHKTDEYKYRKYRRPFSSAKITEDKIKEEVKWNGDTEVIDSETNITSSNVDISAKTKRVTKKINLIGSRIGTVTSYIFGIPSYIIGFILGLAGDKD